MHTGSPTEGVRAAASGPRAQRTRADVRAPASGERAAVHAWLARGLRPDRPGDLAAEYPMVFGPGATPCVRVAFVDGRPVAHALAHAVDVQAGRRRLRVGLIGHVYTDPRHRGRGLASACVRACLEALDADRVPLALLWSELDDFYRRLGFHRAGREWIYSLDRQVLAAARRSVGGALPACGPVQETDWPALEALYAARRLGVARAPGALRTLAAAPRTRLCVARRRGAAVAYAALGRGADFPDVVHEWAGAPDGVLACLSELAREHESIAWLAGPEEAAPAAALRAAGAARLPGDFAFAHLLDPAALWSAAIAGVAELADTRLEGTPEGVRLSRGADSLVVSTADALALVMGPRPPEPALELLGPAAHGVLPWPLYVWGFDSV